MTQTERSVLLVSSNRWNSAITEYLVSAAISLKKMDYNITIVCKDHSAAYDRIRKLGFRTVALKKFNLLSYATLNRLCREHANAAILTFGGPETTLINFMRLPNAKRIRFRGQNFHDSWKFRLSSQISHFNFKGLISPAKWLAEKLNKSLGTDCHHIDLGMDDEKFQSMREPSDKPTLTLLARFDPVKGHRKFFRIFSKVISNWPSGIETPVLRLIGREENIQIPQLRSWGKELKIEEFISIETQKIESIEEDMNATTIAVIPSLGSEVICRSAYEFLLCGCPIFVSGVGSLKETLKSPLFGHSYDDRSEDEIAEFLLACLSDALKESGEIRKMRAYEARKYYSFSQMGESLEKVLF